MHVTVTGDAAFKRFSVQLDLAADGLEHEMDRALLETGEDVTAAIRVGTDIYMPSGYEDRFRQSLRTDVEQDKPRRKVTVVAWGRGRSSRRDVERLDKGILRHPVHGRYRELKAGGKYVKNKQNLIKGRYVNPWAVTVIKPGFYSYPVSNADVAMARRTGQAMDRVLDVATE